MSSVEIVICIKMDIKTYYICLLIILPVITGLRKSSQEEHRSGYRGGLHYHTKRHMLPGNNEMKKRMTTLKPREMRKKPSGHLKPLDEDDIENDEIVSVAVGPPPLRPKYEKQWKHSPKQAPKNNTDNVPATNLVKEVLLQLGQEFMTRQISEDFVFGQYVGISMKNLTSDLKLKLQHEILELVVKYQKVNRGELKIEDVKADKPVTPVFLKNGTSGDNEESWPDFSNLAKIVGRRR